jgi:hypothetical protein
LATSFAEGLEAMGSEDTILRTQRHQVGDRAEGGEIEVILYGDVRAAFVAGEAEDLQHTVDELEDQSGGTKRLPRGRPRRR